jgi:hypothetical protein
MPSHLSLTDRLIAELRSRGPSTAAVLGQALGVSQPTISRALQAAGQGITRIGQARRTRYAAVRDVRGLGHDWPVYRIDEQGRPEAFGRLVSLHGADILVSVAEPVDWLREQFADGFFPGIPWFLDDQRPQGFLGRQFAQRWSRPLGLPADILLWNDDAVLAALLLHGDDGPGNFVVGDTSLERALQAEPEVIPVVDREQSYARLAEAALAGDAVGSSAAGEQPKFTAVVGGADGSLRHVIVKFTEVVRNNPAARRWADLLVCEHLAGEVLAEHGNASSSSELLWSQGRLCLEVTRFDRIGAYGRRGCVTLAAWSDAHDGNRDHWAAAASRMRQGGWLDANSLDQVRERWWFGRLIGNADMHFGNLCFFLDGALPLQVTPSYDMLPMMYRPASHGAVVPREFVAAVPTPDDLPCWRRTAAWAETYWQRVSEHPDISEDFRRIAAANRATVERARQRFP